MKNTEGKRAGEITVRELLEENGFEVVQSFWIGSDPVDVFKRRDGKEVFIKSYGFSDGFYYGFEVYIPAYYASNTVTGTLRAVKDYIKKD